MSNNHYSDSLYHSNMVYFNTDVDAQWGYPSMVKLFTK